MPLEREFGWSKATLAAARSLMQIENGLMGPIEGILIDRFGPRIVMTAGTFIFGLGLVLVSLINSVWSYYLVFIVVAVGTSFGGFLVMSTAINNWFRRKRTIAMSIAQTGLGVGGLTVIPLLLWSHDEFGWRHTAIAAGIFTWIIGIPVSLLMRHSPERYGSLPDGDSAEEPLPVAENENATQPLQQPKGGGRFDFTLNEAMKTSTFWMLGLAHGLSIMIINAVAVHQFAHMEQGVGLSVASIAVAITVLSITNIAGRLFGGILGDRYDKRYLAALGMLGASLAMAILAVADSLTLTIVFSVLYGLSWGLRGPLMNAMRGDYFGRASFGKIAGFSSLLTLPPALFGPIFAGVMADLNGDYIIGFLILSALSAIGSVAFLAAKPPNLPLRFQAGRQIEETDLR